MNKKMKILLIFSTRPGCIKMAPIYWEPSKNELLFDITTCITS